MKHAIRLFIVAPLAIGFLSPALTGQVVLGGPWGADADGSVANRSGTSGAGSPFNFGNSETSGGDGVLSDSATINEARGTFSSSVTLLDNLNSFASISTRAETFENATVRGSARAVDTFSYNGAAAAEFSVDINLSGSLVNTTNDPSAFAGNFAEAYAILDTEFLSYDLIVFGLGEVWSPADSVLDLQQTQSTEILSGTLAFTVDPGQTFTIFSTGTSRMYGENGIADASNTVSAGFSGGPVSELSRVSPVPEPKAFALALGLGAVGILLLRRRS